jgi:lysophospholipase L1-like esterase
MQQVTTPASGLSSTFAPVGLLGGSTCAILGDSLANNGEGVAWWIAALSKQAISFPSSAYVQSNPGNTSAQIAAVTSGVTALSPRPRFCLVSAGSNDAAAGVTLATYSTNMQAIVADLRAAGITPILMTTPPRTGVYGRIAEYNLWLGRYAAQTGLPVVDAWSVLVDPATEQYLTAYNSGDGIHPSAAGCKAVAARAVTDLTAVLPRPSSLASLASGVNMYPRAAFAVDTNSDGLANGNAATPSSGLSYSRVSDAAGFWWQRMTLSSASGTKSITGQTIGGGAGATTLAANASAGATTISLAGTVGEYGHYKITEPGGAYEYVRVRALTGSGPYSAELESVTPLRFAHTTGATVTAAFAVGDTVALGARFRNGQNSAKFIVQATFYAGGYVVKGNRILTGPNTTAGFTQSISDGVGYTEAAVPTGTEFIQFSMHADGTTDGTYDFALPFVANLTALGLA